MLVSVGSSVGVGQVSSGFFCFRLFVLELFRLRVKRLQLTVSIFLLELINLPLASDTDSFPPQNPRFTQKLAAALQTRQFV